MRISLLNIKRKSSELFLTLFLIFLSLSFFHSHAFNYKSNLLPEISEESHDAFIDLLLDSDFNCTIHTFNNSITIQNVYQEEDKDLILASSIIDVIENFNSATTLCSNQLRAPPVILV